MKRHIAYGCLIFFLLTPFVRGVSSSPPTQAEPPRTGNFASYVSQEPGPLVAFGQNMIGQNEFQVSFFADDYVGVQRHEIDLMPSILYGIRDNLSLFLRLPVTPSYRNGGDHSAGLEDAAIQLEYAYYTKDTKRFVDQATVVGTLNLPTGSSTKNPPTGNGAVSFFLGGTFSRLYVNWYLFTSEGATLTTPRGNTKFGNQFLYQGGIGRNIFDIDARWIFAWILEADGQYTEKNRVSGTIDPDSGGNVIYLTPSLWVSSKRLIMQFGAGVPVTQHLFGNQTSNNYLLALNLGWTLS